MTSINRRQFLRFVSVGGAMSLLPHPGSAQSALQKTDYDVIIIGAGIAGLAAAHDLAAEGYEVVVLEARDRIGGRIHTDFGLGAPFEWGAGWIHGPDGNPVSELLNATGGRTYVTDDDSLEVFTADGEGIADLELEQAGKRLRGIARKLDEQLESDRALDKAIAKVAPKALDDPLQRWILTSAVEFDTGGPIENLSAYYFADDAKFDGADVIPLDGYDKVLEPLQAGFDVVLGAEVEAVEYEHGDGAFVRVKGMEYESEFVICSAPLGVLNAGTIEFDPILPQNLRRSIDRIPMGTVTKLALKFPTAFWPTDTQYFGVLTEPKGRWPYIFNFRTFSDQNVLMPLSFGAYAVTADAMSDAEMVADAMDVLREVFGADIPQPEAHRATHWSSDRFTRGAYSYAGFGATPGDFDAFKVPVAETVFFAGEHTDFAYHGTVHGALLSGRAAALKVLETDD